MISRRGFIGSLGAMIVAPTIGSVDDELERCKRDILYWVDNYLTAIDFNGREMKMSDQQREYLKRMSETKDYFICAKGRQIGASTANLVFAHWKTRLFENQRVFIVEPSCETARCMEKMDRCIFHRPACAQNGSMIQIATPKMLESGIDWSDPNDTFILDEFAWWNENWANWENDFCGNFFMNLIGRMCHQEWTENSSPIIIPTTPRNGKVKWCMLVEWYAEDDHMLILPNPTTGLKA